MANRVTQIVECIVVLTGLLLFGSALQNAFAQDSANLPYMNPQLVTRAARRPTWCAA